ncbi:MAG: hypothetical protein WD673_14615 [Alphaproteobacteria bacterium]
MPVVRYVDRTHAISVRCDGPNDAVAALVERLRSSPGASGALAAASCFVAACVAAGWRAYASPESTADLTVDV